MSATLSSEVEFRGSRSRLWLGTAGSVMFVVFGLWAVSGGLDDVDDTAPLVGVLCILFFGWTTWLWGKQAIRAGEVLLSIGPKGVHDHRLTTAPVHWDDITGLSTWSTTGATMVVLDVTDEFWSKGTVRPLARRTRAANRALGASGLSIHVMPLGVEPGVVMGAIRGEAARYGKQLD